MGRNKGIFNQPHHRVEAVERAVEAEYARIQLTQTQINRIREGIEAYVACIESESAPQRSDLDAELRRLAAEEKKLLRAHYDDRISEAVFDEEQERIRRERIAAERQLRELDVDHRAVLANLEIALEMTTNIQQAYGGADANGRRLFNQAIFRRIWIDDERIDRTELESPFHEMAEVILGTDGLTIKQETRQRSNHKENHDVRTSGGPLKARTPDNFAFVGSSNVASMVARPGLEPGSPLFSEASHDDDDSPWMLGLS